MDFPVRLISDGKTFSVHTYFDICPESPDGKHVVYSRFTGGIPSRDFSAPKTGHVILVDRDGGAVRVIGCFAPRAAHTGAYALWIDNATVAYQDGAELCIVDIERGATRRLKGACQMFNPAAGAIFQPGEMYTKSGNDFPPGFYRLDIQSGKVSAVITVKELAQLPFVISIGIPYEVSHAKWSPGAKRVAGRIDGNRKEGRYPLIFSCLPDGSDFIPFRYYSNGNIDKPMHWNFYDDNSFYGYDVSRPHRPCCRWGLDGTFVEILHEGDGNHGAVSKNGDCFVTDSWYGVEPRRIMFYRRGDKNPVVLAEMPQSKIVDAHPVFSSDGRRAYFNRTGSDDHGSQVCAVDFPDI